MDLSLFPNSPVPGCPHDCTMEALEPLAVSPAFQNNNKNLTFLKCLSLHSNNRYGAPVLLLVAKKPKLIAKSLLGLGWHRG